MFTGTWWPEWTVARTKDPIPRSLQQLTMALSQLAFRRALLKAFGKFGLFKAWATHLPAWPCNKHFCVPNSTVLVVFGLTVRQEHSCVSVTTWLCLEEEIGFLSGSQPIFSAHHMVLMPSRPKNSSFSLYSKLGFCKRVNLVTMANLSMPPQVQFLMLHLQTGVPVL